MLYYEIAGPAEAQPIMLSGSLGTTLGMWDPQMTALTEHFRVIRFDHRGHGRSPVTGECSIADLGGDVLELLDRLKLPVVSFAGLSLGGMVGMWLAAHAPERIDRLALLCTSAKLGTPDSWSERASAVRAGGTASITEAAVGRWFTPGFGGREPYVAMLSGISDEGYAACCGAIGAMDLRPDLPRIKAPTLVLAGADDPATPPEHAERIVSGIAGSRLVVLAGAAHLANVERPDAVSQHLIRHFMEE
ncbi:3-oxoadipate enol-lactonase [Streptosporangium sp. 'caverna']|uniref:3-oxoadipate enol-lactonase n=1 Tax=Streptosporangium sp. 'caverna' TaxID=2202249 RepID=UPI000D7E7F8C|nr:3-oxoadipate enol-lactonase [Streptosporangium sp. 'caverna']AWS47466.1 3-oxoadipate enol-lactonase [Streptosporangium sp. 'caverna']